MGLTEDQKIKLMDIAVTNSKTASAEDTNKVIRLYKVMITAIEGKQHGEV